MSQALTTPAAVLRTAQAILRDEGWCKAALFRDEKGELIRPADWKGGTIQPVSCCSVGAVMEAIRRQTGLTRGDEYRDLYGECHRLLIFSFGDAVTAANDHPLRKLPSILRAFSRAIRAAEKAPAGEVGRG